MAPAVAASAGTNPSSPITGNAAIGANGNNTNGQLWSAAVNPNNYLIPPPAANFAGSVVIDTYNGATKTVTNPCTPATMAKAAMVSAGGDEGMALIAGGYVCVWGDDYWGEEAQGESAPTTGPGLNPTGTLGPVPVCLPESWTLVTAPHTGYGYCNDKGLLLKGVKSISAGGAFALALLGKPSQIPADTTVTPHIAASALPAGTVSAWGANYSGELGSNWSGNSPTAPYACSSGNSDCAVAPVAVGGGACGNTTNPYLDNVSRVSAGYNFALAETPSLNGTTGGTVCSWGDNTFGQLGLGGSSNVTTPGGDSPNNCPYPGGSASNYCSWTPQPVVSVCDGQQSTSGTPGPLNNVYDISAGDPLSLALLTNGYVCSWGDNTHGELGIGTNSGPNSCSNNNVPPYPLLSSCALAAQQVAATASCPNGTNSYLGTAYQISAGAFFGMALISSVPWTGGTVCTWGDGAGGALGNGAVADSYAPVAVWGVGGSGFLATATCISAGWQHALAVISPSSTTTGTLVTWGNDAAVGQNNGASTLFPVNFVTASGMNVTKISMISAGLGEWNLVTAGTKGCNLPPPAP